MSASNVTSIGARMTKIITCFGGEQVLVDDEDFELLNRFKWSYNGQPGNKYARAGGDRKSGQQVGYYLHRLVMGGKSPDHINGNTLDKCKANLRIATVQENGWNTRKRGKCRYGEPKSKYKGVSPYKSKSFGDGWQVIIKLTKKGVKPTKHVRFGPFKTEIEAARVYNIEIVKYRGKFAWINPLPVEAN